VQEIEVGLDLRLHLDGGGAAESDEVLRAAWVAWVGRGRTEVRRMWGLAWVRDWVIGSPSGVWRASGRIPLGARRRIVSHKPLSGVSSTNNTWTVALSIPQAKGRRLEKGSWKGDKGSEGDSHR
jgi:hypothetical protein